MISNIFKTKNTMTFTETILESTYTRFMKKNNLRTWSVQFSKAVQFLANFNLIFNFNLVSYFDRSSEIPYFIKCTRISKSR